MVFVVYQLFFYICAADRQDLQPLSSLHSSISVGDTSAISLYQSFCVFVVLFISPEGRPGMSDVSPLSGISGLSFDSTLLSPLLCFCLVLLPCLSDLFLPAGPFFLNFFQKILQYFSLRDRLFRMAPV